MNFSIACHLLGLIGPCLPTSGTPRVLGCKVEMIPPSSLPVPGSRTELRAGRKESGQEQHQGAEHGETCTEGLEEIDGDSLHSI